MAALKRVNSEYESVLNKGGTARWLTSSSATAGAGGKKNCRPKERELIAAGFKRRDLLKMGLLTSAGMLVAKK